jgi:hypothetical protein
MAQVTLTTLAAMKALSMHIPNWVGMPIPYLFCCVVLGHVIHRSKVVLMIHIGNDEIF